MSFLDLIALGLPFTLVINVAAFVVCWVAARRAPGIRALIDRRWVSFGIALTSAFLVVFAILRYSGIRFEPEVGAALIGGPVYLLTAINVVFLWLTWRGRW